MSALQVSVSGVGLDIGFVAQGWSPDAGGIESHTLDLATELIARGHRVHVLCLDSSSGLVPYSVRTTRVGDVEVRRMAYRYHDHGALRDLAISARAEDVVLAWLAETPCDIIHVHHLTGFGASALRAIAEMGRPLVMTLHDYWMLCPRGQMLRHDGAICDVPEASVCGECLAKTWPHLMPSGTGRPMGPSSETLANDADAAAARTRFALEMLALPQRLIVPSQAALEVFVRAGVPRERLAVVEHGLELEQLARDVSRLRGAAAPRRADGSPHAKQELHLGVLGSVLPSKGVLELARAVIEGGPDSLVLDVHGDLPAYHGDSSYIDALRALAESNARIRLHGPYHRVDLAQILSQLDGVAAPSRWCEVYGLSVREARAAGLPVLVSDRGALPLVAHDGLAGIVVPADDRAAWIAALRRFATDPAARERWGRGPSGVRPRRDMALDIERAYVETIDAVTGHMPPLAHPVAGEAPPPPAPPTKPKRGFLGRLFGG